MTTLIVWVFSNHLGKAGYKSIGLLFGGKSDFVISSKYTSGIITAKDPQACIDKYLQIFLLADLKILSLHVATWQL